jgi:hypothetical protein
MIISFALGTPAAYTHMRASRGAIIKLKVLGIPGIFACFVGVPVTPAYRQAGRKEGGMVERMNEPVPNSMKRRRLAFVVVEARPRRRELPWVWKIISPRE